MLRSRLCRVLILLLVWIIAVFLATMLLGKRQNKTKPELTVKNAAIKVQPTLKQAQAVNMAARMPGKSKVEWCTPQHYLPDPKTRPTTALASFPGSGNTWLRYLLQQSTGVYTGSIYRDWDLIRSGFIAENVKDGSVSVVKLHEWGKVTITLYHRAVLLIRTPGPAILAEYNRQVGGHTGFASPQSFRINNGKRWEKFADSKLVDWKQLNLVWLQNFTGPLHVVVYEELLTTPESTLRALVQFLDLPLEEEALRCTLENSEGAYHRRPREDNLHFDPFTPEMKEKLKSAQEIVFSEVKRHRASKMAIS